MALIETGFHELHEKDFANGFRHLEMATKLGLFESLDYRRTEVFRALGYCCEKGIGTAINKAKATHYRQRMREQPSCNAPDIP